MGLLGNVVKDMARYPDGKDSQGKESEETVSMPWLGPHCPGIFMGLALQKPMESNKSFWQQAPPIYLEVPLPIVPLAQIRIQIILLRMKNR